VHPFDIRSVLLAKHAQHVALVHFPIALFLIGTAFDLAAQRSKRHDLTTVAHYNLILAAIFTVPVFATGLVAWQWALEGARLKGVLLLHLVFASASSVLICIAGWIHGRALKNPGLPQLAFRLPIEAVAAILIAITGHLGGYVSGVST
jgi:uncharacterized membrane protein